jgi:hypothetical protein
MLAQVLQIFRGKEHLVKNWLISTLDKEIYIKGTICLRSMGLNRAAFLLSNVYSERKLAQKNFVIKRSGAYLKGLTLPRDLRQRGTFGGP